MWKFLTNFFNPQPKQPKHTMNKIIEALASILSISAPAIAGANPVVSLGLFAIEEAIKQEPAIAQELQALFATGTVTPEQIAALRAKIASESYAGFVPASALPSQTPPAATDAAVIKTDAVKGAADKAPEVADAAPAVTCPVCNQPLVADSPDNCSCPTPAPAAPPATA
jgi:hypothetical protein